MMKRFALLPLTLLVLVFACSKQGEGERCNLLNNNGDCDDGLTCSPAKGSNACTGSANDRFDCLPSICCPPAPQRSAVAQCNLNQYGQGAATGGSTSVADETGGSDATGGEENTGGTTSTDTEPADAGP